MKIPREAKTEDQLCELEFDNVNLGLCDVLLTDTDVTFYGRHRGEVANFSVRREDIDRFVDWYEKGIKPNTEKRK